MICSSFTPLSISGKGKKSSDLYQKIHKPKTLSSQFLHKSLAPFALSLSLIASPLPAIAGLLSGFPGIESIPGPQLPEVGFLKQFNEENQKKYAEFDARFKDSPVLKQLLEKSKLNKEKNKQEIQDKYCLRGAEWGVGDCSAEGMSPQEREDFIAMLKQKTSGSATNELMN